MKPLQLLFVVLSLVLVQHNFAQNNVFLNREFWNSNTNIAQVDTHIQQGNHISELNSNGFDAVVYAILQDAPFETIKYIISKDGNDANKLTHDGRTYIFWAAYKARTDVMQFLLKAGAKTNVLDNHGYSILNFAANAGVNNTTVYDLCLKHGANLKTDLNRDGANALLLAAPHDLDFSLINYFTAKGLSIHSVDANGNGIFNYVSKTGNVNLLKKLVSKGVKGNNQAFLFAATGTRGKTNGLEVFEYLESMGLNANVQTKEAITPLHILASRTKDIQILNFFIERGLDVNATDTLGNTPFLNASNTNSLEIVKHLMSFNKDINLQNKKGESALTLAVKNNNHEVVSYLLKAQANANITDVEGNNLAYHLVSTFNGKEKENFKEKAQILENHMVDFSVQQAGNNTLYHIAIEKQDLELLKFLEAYNIDINAKNNQGLSVLHLAAMKAKDATILQYLISKGADKKAITSFDETVYDLASENEQLKANQIDINFLK